MGTRPEMVWNGDQEEGGDAASRTSEAVAVKISEGTGSGKSDDDNLKGEEFSIAIAGVSKDSSSSSSSSSKKKDSTSSPTKAPTNGEKTEITDKDERLENKAEESV